MKTFKLEEYLTKYEFTAPYLLCCSDPESFTMQEIINLAKGETKELWQNLTLNYTEPYGHPLLRRQVVESLYPTLEDDNILCFAGAEEGIFAALTVLCNKDDHAIVLAPCYQSLYEVPKSRGTNITRVMLREENSWRIDLAEITKAIKTNTKCIIINFPHNPTGAVITKEELQRLVDICRQHDIWLFSDEVYYGLGTPQKGWAPSVCSLYDKALSLNVMSKSFGMAGLRVGWLACQDKNILHKIKQIKDYLSICCSAPAEIISIIAMQNREYIWQRNNEIIRHNFALLEEFLRKYSELFSWVKPQGGCIGFVKYHGKESVNDLCSNLVKEKGVLLMPANIYDHDSNHFRIGFGRKNMPDALERLKDFLNENL